MDYNYHMSSVKIKNDVTLNIPSWAAVLYICASVVLMPWTIYLGYALPVSHITVHWDVIWIGLDIAIIGAMLSTAALAYLKSRWVVITATVLATLLLADAWFDVMSARRSRELHQAVIEAVLLEIPVALASIYLAYRVLKHNI